MYGETGVRREGCTERRMYRETDVRRDGCTERRTYGETDVRRDGCTERQMHGETDVRRDGCTERRKDMTKIIGVCRYCKNAPKNIYPFWKERLNFMLIKR